jgi:hypothetical protein
MGTLRTPFMLTKEMQEDYYRNVICNRESRTRYWAFRDAPAQYNDLGMPCKNWLLGYGGIENIEWENRRGEISVLIDPAKHGQKLGTEAVNLILDQAFNYLNLMTVYGECFMSGPHGFWRKILTRLPYQTDTAILPAKKYYKGDYHGSFYFTIFKQTLTQGETM